MLAKLQRNIIAGIFIVVPIWVTVWVLTFLIDLLIQFGNPIASQLARRTPPPRKAHGISTR